MNKLYVIVRSDLEPGLQIAQSIHAAREFAELYPKLDLEWHTKHKNIVVLQARDVAHLEQLYDACSKNFVPCAEFLEPDLDNALTAIACADTAQPLVSSLPLALRAPKISKQDAVQAA